MVWKRKRWNSYKWEIYKALFLACVLLAPVGVLIGLLVRWLL